MIFRCFQLPYKKEKKNMRLKIVVVVVTTSAQHSMSLGWSQSGDPSLTSSVGSTPTKYTMLFFNSLLCCNISIKITGGEQILGKTNPLKSTYLNSLNF
jgi:hypothetical protein